MQDPVIVIRHNRVSTNSIERDQRYCGQGYVRPLASSAIFEAGYIKTLCHGYKTNGDMTFMARRSDGLAASHSEARSTFRRD